MKSWATGNRITMWKGLELRQHYVDGPGTFPHVDGDCLLCEAEWPKEERMSYFTQEMRLRQFRFPKSRRRRIVKKWEMNRSNWRMTPVGPLLTMSMSKARFDELTGEAI